MIGPIFDRQNLDQNLSNFVGTVVLDRFWLIDEHLQVQVHRFQNPPMKLNNENNIGDVSL